MARRGNSGGVLSRLTIAVLAVLGLVVGAAVTLLDVGDIIPAGLRAGDPAATASNAEAALAQASEGAPSGVGEVAPAADEASEPSAALPDHRLRVATRPNGAAVTVVAADGTKVGSGTSPYVVDVPEGRAAVTVTNPGHQPLTRTVRMTQDRRVRWWLDPRGQLHHKVRAFDTGAAPKQVAFSPDGRQLWVTLLGGPGVEVYRPRTGRKLATIDLGNHGAVEVIFTADGTTAYASQMESGSVYEIDTATFEIGRRLSTGGAWTKVMALSPDERLLYASNWSSNDVSEIDLGSGKVLRRIPTVGTPRGLYVTPDGKKLYVAGFDGGELQRIHLRSGASRIITDTGGAMRHLVGDPDGTALYAGDMGVDAVFVHDLDGRRVRKLADTDAKPNTIDLGADGKVLYVSNRGANNPESYYLPGPEWGSVLVLDTATGDPLDAIVGGNQTTGLDVSDDGALLAFSDFLDDRVQVYEIPPYDVLADGNGGRYGAHRQDLIK